MASGSLPEVIIKGHVRLMGRGIEGPTFSSGRRLLGKMLNRKRREREH